MSSAQRPTGSEQLRADSTCLKGLTRRRVPLSTAPFLDLLFGEHAGASASYGCSFRRMFKSEDKPWFTIAKIILLARFYFESE